MPNLRNLPTAAASSRKLITITEEKIRELREMSDKDFEQALTEAKQDPAQKNARVL